MINEILDYMLHFDQSMLVTSSAPNAELESAFHESSSVFFRTQIYLSGNDHGMMICWEV